MIYIVFYCILSKNWLTFLSLNIRGKKNKPFNFTLVTFSFKWNGFLLNTKFPFRRLCTVLFFRVYVVFFWRNMRSVANILLLSFYFLQDFCVFENYGRGRPYSKKRRTWFSNGNGERVAKVGCATLVFKIYF